MVLLCGDQFLLTPCGTHVDIFEKPGLVRGAEAISVEAAQTSDTARSDTTVAECHRHGVPGMPRHWPDRRFDAAPIVIENRDITPAQT